MFTIENVLRACSRNFSRPVTNCLWPQLFYNGIPFHTQIIEMRGPSKEGINLILMEILTRMALPLTYDNRTSGRNGSILYFSCLANFDPYEFRSYLVSILSQYITDPFYLHHLLAYTMSNLHVFDMENLNPNFISNQILDKFNIGLIVIDCLDGYEPEINLGIGKTDYLKKIEYLKPLLVHVNALTIYICNDMTEDPPKKEVFKVINNVFVIEKYCDIGVQINTYTYNREHEVIFVDPVLLHT